MKALCAVVGLVLCGLFIQSIAAQNAEVIIARRRAAGGSTPTLIQSAASPSDTQAQDGFNSSANNTNAFIQVCFANATKTGNSIIVAVRTVQTTLADVSITDDGSNTYAQPSSATVTGGTRRTIIFIAPVTTTSRCVNTVFSAISGNGNEVEISEYQNIATTSPVDGTPCSGSVTSGTAPACSGAITTTANGDLVLAFLDVVTFSSTPTGPMSFTAQTGASWSLLNADGTSWYASQAEVQAASGNVTPAITISQATTRANIVGIALKAATSGSTYSGIHVNRVTTYAPAYAFSSGTTTGTTEALQFPCSGNSIWLMVGQGASGATSNTTSVTDSNSNSFTKLGNVYSSGDGYAIQWIHADSATCNGTETFTLHFTAGATFLTVIALDIANATGVDTGISCTGSATNQCPINIANSTSTTTFAGAVATPSTANGVMLSYQNQDFQSMFGVSVGNFAAPIISCPSATGGCTSNGTGSHAALAYVGSGFGQDAGLMIDYYSSTSAVTITWTIAQTQGNSNSGELGPAFSSTAAVKQ